jgi:hypothetical protein
MESIEPTAQVVETQPIDNPLTRFTLTPTDLDAVERGAAVPEAGPNEA